MSYTVDIVSGPVPLDDREAWAALKPWREDLHAASDHPSDEMRTLHDRLTARYPCICVDKAGPWSDGPLINNFGKQMAILGLSYSRVEEVLPFVIGTALDMSFTVFDGQDDRIYRPGRDAPVAPRSKTSSPSRFWKRG